MSYNYDFHALSEYNVYFLLTIRYYKATIEEKITLSRKKLAIASMHYTHKKAYAIGVHLLIQEILLQQIVEIVDNAIDNGVNRDIIYTQIINKGKGRDRQFYRERNRQIQILGYNLAKNGITDKFVADCELYKYFSEFTNIPREIKKRKGRNKTL